MITRFEGADGRRRLIEQLRRQLIIGGDAAAAAEIANVATILEVSGGQVLIRQDGEWTNPGAGFQFEPGRH